MKKFPSLFLTILLSASFLLCIGCDKAFHLENYVTEQRIDIAEGNSESYSVKCNYGFITEENSKVYSLSFVLPDEKDDTVSHNLSFSLNGKTYNGAFAFSPTVNAVSYTAVIESTKEVFPLNVTIGSGSKREVITLSSIIPPTIKPVNEALDSLYVQQKTFIDGFFTDGNFNGKLTVRVVEKDGKGYYYVGFTDIKGKLKAMLIDGETSELLAIRDVF